MYERSLLMTFWIDIPSSNEQTGQGKERQKAHNNSFTVLYDNLSLILHLNQNTWTLRSSSLYRIHEEVGIHYHLCMCVLEILTSKLLQISQQWRKNLVVFRSKWVINSFLRSKNLWNFHMWILEILQRNESQSSLIEISCFSSIWLFITAIEITFVFSFHWLFQFQIRTIILIMAV